MGERRYYRDLAVDVTRLDHCGREKIAPEDVNDVRMTQQVQ